MTTNTLTRNSINYSRRRRRLHMYIMSFYMHARHKSTDELSSDNGDDYTIHSGRPEGSHIIYEYTACSHNEDTYVSGSAIQTGDFIKSAFVCVPTNRTIAIGNIAATPNNDINQRSACTIKRSRAALIKSRVLSIACGMANFSVLQQKNNNMQINLNGW